MKAERGIVRRIFSVLILLSPLTCGAAEPAPGQLLQRCSWLRFEVAAGRIVAAHLHRAPNRALTAEPEGTKESLLLNPSGSEASFTYSFASDSRQWTLEYHDPSTLTITDVVGEHRLTFSQHPERPITLAIQEGSSPPRTSSASSLWHLLVLNAEARDKLLPQLALVSSSWELGRQTTEIPSHLFAAVKQDWRSDRRRWLTNLRELASADYQVRQNAEQKLRSGGHEAVGCLQMVERSSLSAEQQRRIEVLREAASQSPDEPASVAAAWVYDAGVWCHFLEDSEEERRTIAANHLTQLLGRKLPFDPHADETQRIAQLKTIRSTLIRR